MTKQFLTIVSLLVAFLFSSETKAQSTTKITGRIQDEAKKSIDLAMVSLLRTSDSTYVKSEYTDEDGSFTLGNVSVGDYILQVNVLGYETVQNPLKIDGSKKSIALESITLKTAVSQLGEVTITAKVPYIERKIDRTVINVDAQISNAGSDIMEVMERAPGISLDNDGSILLKGRAGVAVFINDKPSYLSGSELESYLRSLPAGSVKQIEIMTNPPAKYEAAGNSGVINIILKKNKLQGVNGNVALSFRQGRYSGSNNSFNINYNKNKIGIYSNLSGGFWNSFQDLNINRYYRSENDEPLSSFRQNSFNKNNGRYGNVNVGMDYYVNDNSTLGVSYKLSNNRSNRNNDNTSRISDAQNNLSQKVLADNTTDGTFANHVYNAYFKHNLDTIGSTISVDADYVTYRSGSDQTFINSAYNPSDSLTYQDQINGELPSDISIYAVKSDYTKVISDNAKFEAGVKSAFTTTDNEAIYSTTIDGVTEANYDLSNRFQYDEWINAVYGNYSQQFGRLGVQLGLRVESTTMNGNQLGNIEKPDTSFTREYTNAFPTVYTSYKMDTTGNNVMTFSYGRRIDRPFFQDLNPFVSPLDKFTFYSGNPNLLPTFSHNFSLAHSYKSFFTTTVNYSKTIDGINETLEIRDGIYYSRPGNIANSQTLSLSFEASIPVTKWYTINSYLELTHLEFDSPLYTEQLSSRGTYHYLSATNNFTLGKGWSADVTGMYRSDMVYAQLVLKRFGQVNIGVKKNILDNAGSLKLSVNDLFFTRTGNGIINNLQLTDADWNSTYSSQTATLTFSWRFGNSSLKKQKYNSNGSDAEQNRVKQ